MLHYGACYYPEQWTAEQAKDHIPLMRKAGVTVVRMGEFAWSRFEPELGRYHFDWMDRVIQDMQKAGIATVLCTPTAVPPQWAVVKYPQILGMDRDGRRRHPGSRHHACKNTAEFQTLAEKITRELAKHYGAMDSVIGWQTDNELGGSNTTRCYCDNCEKAFRDWLIAKYGSTDALNEAWGSAFWGFEARQWNEIPLPRVMPTGNNPSHWLDYVRFASDTQIKFHKMQTDVLRLLAPKQFVTHNSMGRFDEIDYYKLAKHTDFLSWDNYPDAHGDPMMSSYEHEMTRSHKGSFWVMEQKSGPGGSAKDGLWGEPPDAGAIRRWAWQAVANGADGLCFFRWRAALAGAEQYCHGILDHDGTPRKRYSEVALTGKEFAKIGPQLERTRVETKIALIRSFDCLWSIERQPGAPGFRYDDHCFELYRAVKRTGHPCDIVNVDTDLNRYKVVLAPCLTIVDDATAQSLTAFVKGGGTLVLTPQSGARNVHNRMFDTPRPGPLAELAGVTVEEIRAYHHGQTHEISFARGSLIAEVCAVGGWVEALNCGAAESVAEYRDGPSAAKTAIARNAVGSGQVYYLGVYLPREILERFLSGLVPVLPIKDIPEGVEVVRRKSAAGRFIFILNHSGERQTITLPGQILDLLTEEKVGPKITLSANGVLILKG
ncbi:MAG: beta-galactosidase [Candidatus Hydrogenedentes bacterium]|nr:beta-galactosidase [Candidatus Hydrogenedentota bacterium]